MTPDKLLGVDIGPNVVPMAAHPTKTAARLPCGHRFNAMALVVHFAKNNLQCPLCRKGSPTQKLHLGLTFPGEPWVGPVEANILLSAIANRDASSSNNRQDDQIWLLYNSIEPATTIFPVHATFFLYGQEPPPGGGTRRLPSIAMRCCLEPISHPFFSDQDITLSSWFTAAHAAPPPPLRYRLPTSFARLLHDQMWDMQITSFQIHIYATCEGLVIDMAHLQPTAYPLPADFTPVVEPSSEQITFTHPNNANTPTALPQFVYTPSQNTIVSIIALLL